VASEMVIFHHCRNGPDNDRVSLRQRNSVPNGKLPVCAEVELNNSGVVTTVCMTLAQGLPRSFPIVTCGDRDCPFMAVSGRINGSH
jgi:hypothetical protein